MCTCSFFLLTYSQTAIPPVCAYANARVYYACVCLRVSYLDPGGALSGVCSSQTADLLLPFSLMPAAPWRDCVSPQLKTGFGAPPTH